MEKVFEALDFLKQQAIAFEHSELAIKVANGNHTIVKQALTELKVIKEAEPSEAMKELEQNIKDRIILAEDRQLKLCAIIKQALLKAQEQDKVLEILKPLCEVVETPVKKLRYLKMNGVVVYTFKTEEEFDLLKHYFEKNIQKQ